MHQAASLAAAGDARNVQLMLNAINASAVLCIMAPPSRSIARIRVARRRPPSAIDLRLAATGIERVGHAVQEASRSGGLALLIAGEGAVAEPGRIIALQTER